MPKDTHQNTPSSIPFKAPDASVLASVRAAQQTVFDALLNAGVPVHACRLVKADVVETMAFNTFTALEKDPSFNLPACNSNRVSVLQINLAYALAQWLGQRAAFQPFQSQVLSLLNRLSQDGTR